ncbi:MAG TPA: phage major capsid protein [Alphaproteobacteria bacterium]|nr:phage major capsid protein [Alphaproteobacteria bacterium]
MTQKNTELFGLESSLTHLENAFETFQNTQTKQLKTLEEKMTHLSNFSNRPFVSGSLETKSLKNYDLREFKDFMNKGSVPLHQKALSTQSHGGGYLLSSPMKEFVKNVMGIYSPLRSLCRVTSLTSEALDLVLDQGGNEVGWSQEEGEFKETEVSEIKKLTIPVHQLYAKPKVSQKLLDDAGIDVEEYLLEKISEQMAFKETQSFISGDGQGKPKGFLSYDKVNVGEGKFGVLETIKTGKNGEISSVDCLFDMFQSLKQEYLPDAVWFMSRSALTEIRKLCDSRGLSLWQPSLSLNHPSTLLGHSVIMCDHVPGVLKEKYSTPVVFSNFKKAYQIVDRSEVQVLRDPYSCKPFVEFYATKRVGGDVFNFDAMKVLSFSE